MAFGSSTIALFCYPVVFNAPTDGFPWDDPRKILRGGQRIAKVWNGEKYCRKFQRRR